MIAGRGVREVQIFGQVQSRPHWISLGAFVHSDPIQISFGNMALIASITSLLEVHIISAPGSAESFRLGGFVLWLCIVLFCGYAGGPMRINKLRRRIDVILRNSISSSTVQILCSALNNETGRRKILN